MSYPTITETTAQSVMDDVKAQPKNVWAKFTPTVWELIEKPSEVDFDEMQLNNAISGSKNWWESLTPAAKKKNQMLLEGRVAVDLHSFLSYHDHQFEFVEDPDFWRYLAVFPLRWFLIARHPDAAPESFGGLKIAAPGGTHVTRPQFINQLIFRTYLRGQIAFDLHSSNQYSRSVILETNDAVPTDIWQSHLLRTELGQLGECAHSFIDAAIDCKLVHKHSPLQPARDAAKLLTRAKHNVLFDIRSSIEMRSFVDDVFL